VSASDTQSADSYLRSRTIPIASPPCPPSRAFVQSGFNEVAPSAKPRRHPRTTSQNPPDSQIGMSVIQAPKGVWHAPIRFDRCAVGKDRAALFWQADRSWALRGRQPFVSRSCAVDRPYRQPMERSAADVRQLEYGVQALSRLGKGRRFHTDFRCRLGRSRYGVRHGRCNNRQNSTSRGGRKKETHNQALGKSKGGWTTKILALTDALGNLVRFILLPGHRFDTVGVAPLIKDLEFGGLIADKAFDSNWIIEDMNERKAKVVISQHQRRAKPLDIDKDI